MLHAVVMAGGSGTRFWPLSRQNRPKHLLALSGERSLVQQTVARIAPLVTPERTWVVTGADHADELRRQLPQLPESSFLVEPCRRDTAACIGLAAAVILRQDAAAVLVVLPADHVIQPDSAFRRSIELAASLVAGDPRRLITFGIKPDRPATGYGYIERGENLPHAANGTPVFRARSFREKPDRELAEQLVASGEFYWNSGIFVWSARTILDELAASQPATHAALGRVADAWAGPDRTRVLAREYESLERVSIDYAVMERARQVLVIEAGFQWDDVGSWQAIERLRTPAPGGNTVIGTHCGLDTHDSIVVSDPDHLVATVGVEHLVIVQSGNVTLVADKREEESVKRLVEMVRQRGLVEFL